MPRHGRGTSRRDGTDPPAASLRAVAHFTPAAQVHQQRGDQQCAGPGLQQPLRLAAKPRRQRHDAGDERHRKEMTRGDRQQGKYGARPLAAAHRAGRREDPAGGGIEAVHGAQRSHRQPGPGRVHGVVPARRSGACP